MNIHFNFVSKITKVVITDFEKNEITDYLLSIQNNIKLQQELFRYCEKYKTAPWVYLQMQKLAVFDLLEKSVQKSFSAIYEKTKKQNENRNKEAVRFLEEFVKNGVEVAILKGNMLIHTTYHNSGYKRMNDFDILVHKEDWVKVQNIYHKLGYIPLGFGWSGEKKEAAKFSHTGISFISPNFQCIVGTQWGLKSPTTKYNDLIDLAWTQTEPFDFYGVPVKKLSTPFNLLHLVLHLGIFKCGIRDCMDIYNLLLTDKEIDKTEISELFRNANASDKAYFALVLSNLCSKSIPNELLQEVKPQKNGFVMKRLKKRLKAAEEAGDLHISYNDYFQDIEKNVIYFNLFTKFHQRIGFLAKIIRQIYFPKAKIALRLSDSLHKPTFANLLKARLKAPYYVFSLIAEEIGWKFSLLLFVKLFFDTLFSLKNYFFKQESYFSYLKKIGINPSEIEKVVKNIQ